MVHFAGLELDLHDLATLGREVSEGTRRCARATHEVVDVGTDDEALLAASEAVVNSDDVPELEARSVSSLPPAKKLRSRRTKISSSDISLGRLVGGGEGEGEGLR